MDKLFTWKDINGDEQYKVITLAGELLDQLQARYGKKLWDILLGKESPIIGLAIVGSTVKGYATYPEKRCPSDLDVSIIYDDSRPNSHIKLMQAIEQCFPKFEQKAQQNIQFIGDINIAKLSQKNVIRNPGSLTGTLFPILGNVSRIKECHKKIRELIVHLSGDEKEAWVQRFVDNIYEGTSKQVKRGFIRAEQVVEYKKKRKLLYEKRIRELFIN